MTKNEFKASLFGSILKDLRQAAIEGNKGSHNGVGGVSYAWMAMQEAERITNNFYDDEG